LKGNIIVSSLIARGGYPVLLTVLAIALLFFAAGFFANGQTGFYFKICSAVCFLFLIFSFYFFRDPERGIKADPNLIICPADGLIIDIRETTEPLYFNSTAKRVSIFMSVFNVHVNRSPVDGKIKFMKYNKGKFISAFKEKASEDNENLFIGIEEKRRKEKIGVKFIAGLIARRIMFYNKMDDELSQGERINLIRFGSRVDLFLPLDTEILVKNGDKVKAGETIMGRFSSK
jgi:phosphatidylserine decarboxylase